MGIVKNMNKPNHKKSKTYSDGAVEDFLFNLYAKEVRSEEIDVILKNNPSWPLRYHISPDRENLLAWFDFNKESSLLEVGAGCGALTGLFLRKVKFVTAVELTKKRSDIIRNRYKDANNLKVITNNIQKLNMSKKFDYVTSIGVLEYSGLFIEGNNPYQKFLRILKNFLKPRGQLILAIENKFGIKYWAGIPEDHTGRYFDSLEGYQDNKGIETFGKNELKQILNRAGFNNLHFYYPLPDYKFPSEIYSDDYLPAFNYSIDVPNSACCFEENLFDQRLVTDNLIKENIFDFFSNSFLIFAK